MLKTTQPSVFLLQLKCNVGVKDFSTTEFCEPGVKNCLVGTMKIGGEVVMSTASCGDEEDREDGCTKEGSELIG